MKSWIRMGVRAAAGLCLAAGLALAACSPDTSNNQSQAPASPATPAAQIDWHAIAPSTVDASSSPVVMHLGEGYAFALLPNMSVLPGDTVTARFSIQGPAGKYVRAIIQRHCDQENGEDFFAKDILLTGQPQQDEIAVTFATTYSCIRVSFVSNGNERFDVSVLDLSVVKGASAP